MSEPETPSPETSTVPAQPPEPSPRASRGASQIPYQAAGRVAWGGYVFCLGLILLVVGIFWRIVEAETSWVTSAWIFASIVAMLVPIAWHVPDFLRWAASPRGGAFLFVTATIGLGLFVAAVLGWATSGVRKTKLPALDLTKSARYTL
jgi:hypothetical protein